MEETTMYYDDKTAISYDDLTDLIIDLLKTNSPSNRLTILNEWLINKDYNRDKLSLVFRYLEFQKNEKTRQGSKGGKNKTKPLDKDKALVEVIQELKDVIQIQKAATVVIATEKPKRKVNTGDHYKRPMWVTKCNAPCDECGLIIDGCAFRWKRSGIYSSYHPTCIPPENKAAFESVPEYRVYYKLD